MVRSALVAALIAGTLAAAGCGDDGSSAGALAPAAQAPAATSTELTDGRLGDATEVTPDEERGLSRGGPLDLRRRGDAPERDGVGAGAACAGIDLAPAPETLAGVTEATLCLLNGERADHGLPPLAANGKLASAASAFAQDLVAGSYFSHTGRDGSGVLDRIERTGYIREDRAWRVGENLAWGTGALATPAAIMQAWMNSPGHRDNILNPHYREMGVGVALGNPSRSDGSGATYATEFGAVAGPAAPAAEKAAKKAAKPKRARGKRRAGAKRARMSRRAGKGRGKASERRRVKGRGPTARIAV
jgi:uncharacterized protein YkwD